MPKNWKSNKKKRGKKRRKMKKIERPSFIWEVRVKNLVSTTQTIYVKKRLKYCLGNIG